MNTIPLYLGLDYQGLRPCVRADLRKAGSAKDIAQFEKENRCRPRATRAAFEGREHVASHFARAPA